MSEADRLALIDFVARNPTTGVSIGGGCARSALPVRAVGRAAATGPSISSTRMGGTPIFRITVFAKNEKANLTASETEAVKALGELL